MADIGSVSILSVSGYETRMMHAVINRPVGDILVDILHQQPDDVEFDHGQIQVLVAPHGAADRSEEHTSELQSLMRISYAVFCLKKKQQQRNHLYTQPTTTTNT